MHLSDYLRYAYLAISRDRLAAYHQFADADEEALARYLWNCALSEALYPLLQAFEVTLRNQLHAAGTTTFGGHALWFVDTALLPLGRREQGMIADARAKLTSRNKVVTAGRLVAELPFGFWTNLFARPYEQRLWAPPALGLLPTTFHAVPRRHRTRAALQPRLERTRQLRNRIFHHEPIWNWSNPALAPQHAEILETLHWLNPAIAETIGLLDRFPAVHRDGLQPYLHDLTSLIVRLPS